MLRQLHRLVEGWKMHDAEHFVRRQRRQLEFDAPKIGKRPFRTDQQVRHVEWTCCSHIQVVTGDAALHIRHARCYFILFTGVQCTNPVYQLPIGCRAFGLLADRSKFQDVAAGQPCVRGEHIVHHVAVTNRSGTATIVCHHATDGRLRRRRYVDRKAKSVWT